MFLGLLILLGIGTYFLYLQKDTSKIRFPGSKNAEEVLMERYVNGEVDGETYKKMKETLNK